MLGELYRLLVAAETRELQKLVRGTPAQPFLDEHNSRMFDSIRSVTSSAVARWTTSAPTKSLRFFDSSRWVKGEDSWRSLHSIQGRPDRRFALDNFGVDASRHFRGHESWRARKSAAVGRMAAFGSSSTNWMRWDK